VNEREQMEEYMCGKDNQHPPFDMKMRRNNKVLLILSIGGYHFHDFKYNNPLELKFGKCAQYLSGQLFMQKKLIHQNLLIKLYGIKYMYSCIRSRIMFNYYPGVFFKIMRPLHNFTSHHHPSAIRYLPTYQWRPLKYRMLLQ
jgi:hypothetical protein